MPREAHLSICIARCSHMLGRGQQRTAAGQRVCCFVLIYRSLIVSRDPRHFTAQLVCHVELPSDDKQKPGMIHPRHLSWKSGKTWAILSATPNFIAVSRARPYVWLSVRCGAPAGPVDFARRCVNPRTNHPWPTQNIYDRRQGQVSCGRIDRQSTKCKRQNTPRTRCLQQIEPDSAPSRRLARQRRIYGRAPTAMYVSYRCIDVGAITVTRLQTGVLALRT